MHCIVYMANIDRTPNIINNLLNNVQHFYFEQQLVGSFPVERKKKKNCSFVD